MNESLGLSAGMSLSYERLSGFYEIIELSMPTFISLNCSNSDAELF